MDWLVVSLIFVTGGFVQNFMSWMPFLALASRSLSVSTRSLKGEGASLSLHRLFHFSATVIVRENNAA